MNITLSAKLLDVQAQKNQQTGELRHKLFFLDTESDKPEVIELKAPKDLDVTQLKQGQDYLSRLSIWRMGDRFGFYIPGADHIKPLGHQQKAS